MNELIMNELIMYKLDKVLDLLNYNSENEKKYKNDDGTTNLDSIYTMCDRIMKEMGDTYGK